MGHTPELTQVQSLGREAVLYEGESGGRVRCTACARYCSIPEGKVGLCGIRGNVDGKLRLFVYGRIIAGHVDPIEKKPVTHYMPGTKIFSIATTGCNWLCHPMGTSILMSDGSRKPVENIVRGDKVWSYDTDGSFAVVPNIVTHVGKRKSRVYEVKYSSGHSLFVTAEHPVFTKSHWKLAKDLRPGEKIVKVWYRNTRAWKEKRRRQLSQMEFFCSECHETFHGISAWNRHRGVCYKRAFTFPDALRAKYSERMRTKNPMRNPASLQKMLATQRRRFLSDPSDGLHRNVDRLRTWLHAHPSQTQFMLYSILDKLGIQYEKEYRITPERSRGAKRYYMADAAILPANLDIEVDGWWHHKSPDVKRADQIRDRALRENGWNVIRLSGRQIFSHPDEVGELLLDMAVPTSRTNKREWVEVVSVKPTDTYEDVYSFECIPNSNYVADGILVHNCHYCQNFDISQRRKVEGIEATPEQVVGLAKKYGAEGLAYTYNQPTIFIEFARDIGLQARRDGLINIFVSNGYDTPETVGMMNDFLDCVTVDFKGSGETNFVRKYIGIPDAEPIFETMREVRDRTKIHIEITDLIVPEIGDSLDAARHLSKWVYDNLGPDTPVHFLRFHPDYKLMHLPWTPIQTLEKHHQVAKEVGLRYVYIGNVPGHPLEHTYCSECGAVAVERYGFDITGWNLDQHNRCNKCGNPIPIVGRLSQSAQEKRFIFVRELYAT